MPYKEITSTVAKPGLIKSPALSWVRWRSCQKGNDPFLSSLPSSVLPPAALLSRPTDSYWAAQDFLATRRSLKVCWPLAFSLALTAASSIFSHTRGWESSFLMESAVRTLVWGQLKGKCPTHACLPRYCPPSQQEEPAPIILLSSDHSSLPSSFPRFLH